MRQLSGLDTLFLNLETNAVPMHIGAVAIIDPAGASPDFGFEHVKRTIERRLHLLPMFRRRLVDSPLNLDKPYWIEDPEFELSNHVRHRALPQPGSDRQLADFVCDIIGSRLDRSAPLWRLYYVEGLTGGRVAVVTKIHHACIDGVSGAELLSVLLDTSADPPPVPKPSRAWRAEALPSPMQLAIESARKMVRRPGEALRLLKESAPILFSAGRDQLARRAARRRSEHEPAAERGIGAAPRMRFNATITALRSYAFRSLPLDDFKYVKNVFECSVNDVLLAISAQALRTYLDERNELPAKALVAAVPVSVRKESEKGTGGNKVVMARTSLATDIADPLERLAHICQRMGRVKKSFKAVPGSLMMDWAEVPAPALLAQAARMYENFGIQDYLYPPYNLVISNIPGPPQSLYLAGARVLSNFPISIPYHGLGFNITVLSYRDSLDVGLTAHRSTVPDIERVMDLMSDALQELKRLAQTAEAARAPVRAAPDGRQDHTRAQVARANLRA